MEKLIHLTDLTNLPLSSNQAGLWIISQQDKFNPAYNIQLTYHLEGKINIDVFSKSMQLLFDRQHTLYSVFKQKNRVPYISIVPSQVIVELVDFSGLSVESRRDDILSFAGENSRKCFDLETGPLFRLFLLKEDENSYFFSAIIHHLIFDGFSHRVFVQEFSKIYNNLLNGLDASLEPIRFHSYDFAESGKKETLSSGDEKKLIEFWKENLRDCPTKLNFPYDYPRNNEPTGFGFRESFEIYGECAEKLRGITREANSSLFHTMLSALGVLFQKYSGEYDICIGVPVSSRQSYQSFKIFGMFVNTVAVRLKMEGNNNFSEYIKYTDQCVKNAVLHSKLPFEKIVEAINPERILGANPFFQVSLTWISDLILPMNLGGTPGKYIMLNKGVSPFDVNFYIWDNGNDIEGEIEYNIDILKHETILRLKNNFLSLINNLVGNSDATIESLSMITDEEKKMIDGFNDTITDYPKEKTIIRLFEDQVNLYPEKRAVVFNENSLTYKQLNERTNQLARTLREYGVIDNTPVGILAEKSLDMIVGILGILKAGGGYVPIDPEYPDQRINFIIRDAGCKVLVTLDKFLETNIGDVRKISLNSPAIFNKEKSDVENTSISSDLAYIMYTSGTTGIPKGTPIPQRGVVRLVRDTNYIEFTPEDRILLAGALVFDATTFEIWGALLNGGMLYVIDKEALINPDLLGEELEKNEITTVLLTSSLFTQIAESRSDIFYKLKYLIVGGDVLSPSHINKVRRVNPQLIVINAYGPTENSCISTYYRIDKDYDNNIPIGKPISNSTAYIFDKNMNYQPIGVIGELYVGGDGVSMGYVNRDDLNNNSFINHPYILGERLYRTGDYAKWLPDGNIEFHGRIDNQLKIRGFRVELGEIESVISEIDGVIETVIKPVKIEEGDYRLVAFLNVSETFELDLKDISSRVRVKLPPYMIPSAYKIMHGFPKTINGKVDRKALNFDLNELKNKSSNENNPLNPTEKLIHEIWCEALNTKDISTTDNFFDIGGNSLLAINLVSLISKAFNITLKTFMIFEFPTIKDQSEFIEGKDSDKLSLKNIKIDEKIQRKKNVNFRKHRE